MLLCPPLCAMDNGVSLLSFAAGMSSEARASSSNSTICSEGQDQPERKCFLVLGRGDIIPGGFCYQQRLDNISVAMLRSNKEWSTASSDREINICTSTNQEFDDCCVAPLTCNKPARQPNQYHAVMLEAAHTA